MRPLPKQIFVTGIGTGVGKTIASAVLTEALNGDYWKPIQCGNLDKTDAQIVQSLVSNKTSKFHSERYRLKTAASPHYAAALEHIKIDVLRCRPPLTDHHLIVEGAGGILVPLSPKALVIDLIKNLNIPVILVTRNYLGSINHTLLSEQVLMQNQVELLGIIFSGGNFQDNENIIMHFSDLPVLFQIDESIKPDRHFISEQALKLRSELSQQFKLT